MFSTVAHATTLTNGRVLGKVHRSSSSATSANWLHLEQPPYPNVARAKVTVQYRPPLFRHWVISVDRRVISVDARVISVDPRGN